MGDPVPLPSVVLVAGTGPGVGLTVTTAALATVLQERTELAVAKLVQTGVADWEVGDVDRIRASVKAVHVHEGVRLRIPRPPVTAAGRAGFALPRVAEHVRDIALLAERAGLVLVEGTGGIMTQLDTRRGTLLDVATALRYKGFSIGFILAARATAADLTTAALTREVLRQRGLPFIGVVLTHWPSAGDLDESTLDLLQELPDVAGVPVLGRIPERPFSFVPAAFAQARTWLDLE